MKYLSSLVSVIRSFPLFTPDSRASQPKRTNNTETAYTLQLSMHMIELERRRVEAATLDGAAWDAATLASPWGDTVPRAGHLGDEGGEW